MLEEHTGYGRFLDDKIPGQRMWDQNLQACQRIEIHYLQGFWEKKNVKLKGRGVGVL